MGIKKTLTKLKKELDSWFSKYIRLRDATSTNEDWTKVADLIKSI